MRFLAEKKHPATIFAQIVQAIWLLFKALQINFRLRIKMFRSVSNLLGLFGPRSKTLGRIVFSKIMVDPYI